MNPQQTIEALVDRLMEDRWQDPRVEAVFDPETHELSYKVKAFGELDMHDTHLEAVLDWRGEPVAVWVGDGFRDLWMRLPISDSGEWIFDPYDTDAMLAEWLRTLIAAHKAKLDESEGPGANG